MGNRIIKIFSKNKVSNTINILPENIQSKKPKFFTLECMKGIIPYQKQNFFTPEHISHVIQSPDLIHSSNIIESLNIIQSLETLKLFPENMAPKINTYNVTDLEINNNLLIITINNNNIIININKNYSQFHYLENELINQPINILFTHLYKIIYKNITVSNEKSIIILLDKNDNPHYYTIDLVYNNNNNNKLIILNKKIETINYNLYTYNKITDTFNITNNNIIIICIDFINSTNLINNVGCAKTISIHKQYYSTIIKLLNNKYYNYIFIHEIIGDSFVLVMNHDNNYNIRDYCTSICIYFLYDLTKLTEKFINTRVGITYDTAYCGYINNNFRIFGNGINLASRLQSNGYHNSILFCNNFYNKLKSEKELYMKLIINIITLELKGFNINKYYRVNFDHNKFMQDYFINKKNKIILDLDTRTKTI